MDAFFEVLSDPEVAPPLKAAAIEQRLADWTRLLTRAVVRGCRDVGWNAAAKGHRLALLPKAGEEYLGLDVMAFGPHRPLPDGEDDQFPKERWPLPEAVFELENSQDDDRVAYSLWKVLCTRAPLRIVFGYRPDWETGRVLVHAIAEAVVRPIPIPVRCSLGGDTLMLLGSRGEGETFPYGYFKVWRLDPAAAVFRKIS